MQQTNETIVKRKYFPAVVSAVQSHTINDLIRLHASGLAQNLAGDVYPMPMS